MANQIALPKELQYRPSQQLQVALNNLNQGLVEAGERAKRPISSQAVLNEVTLPLFNLLSQYIRFSQTDAFGYFYGLCGFIYQQQQQQADDNIILAVDPELSEEVSAVVGATRDNIEKTKAFIRKVQAYFSANKPAAPDLTALTEDEAKKLQAKFDANLELWQGLREDALRVLSLLQESYEDLAAMSDSIDAATYEPDEEPEEEEEEEEIEEGEDEVDLPGGDDAGGGEEEDEPYESILG